MLKIEEYRKYIDALDDEIKSLLIKRLGYCKKIGLVKAQNGLSVEVKEREEEILSRLTSRENTENSEYIEKVYQTIFSQTKNAQKNVEKRLKACLVGANLTHSLSPKIHEFFGTEYTLKELPLCGFKEFFNNNEYSCYNVTMPFKEEAKELLNEVSSIANDIGSVNTVMVKNGKKWGYNTDIDGLNYLFSDNNVSLGGKKVMILGTGGTSKTAQTLVKRNGGECVVVGRNEKINYLNYQNHCDVEILINTAPVGLDGKSCLVDINKLPKLEFVADVLYYPLKTPLLSACDKRGIKSEGGLKMLVYQALKAEEIWQDKNFEADFCKAYKHTLYGYKNIVLTGMPSCGKSVMGRLVAEKLKMKFIDTDEEIEKVFGLSPEKIISESGEEQFRKLESEIIDKISMETGAVIATGGGSVIRSENREFLKRNGIICYVLRPVDLLSTEKRPLSKTFGVEELFKNRKEAYESSCDFTVQNDGTITDCVGRIIDEYEKHLDN